MMAIEIQISNTTLKNLWPQCVVQGGMKKAYFWSFIDFYNSIG